MLVQIVLSATLVALTQCTYSEVGPFELWSLLDHTLKSHREANNVTDCIEELDKIVLNLKNVSYTAEAIQAISNTGKVFNDIGYYDSCMHTGNLTYYLIRPIKTDLKAKFNFGICVPKKCTVEDMDSIVAKLLINKYFLTHIAKGTENTAEDYTTYATEVPADKAENKSSRKFNASMVAVIGFSLLISLYLFLRTGNRWWKDHENSERQSPEPNDRAEGSIRKVKRRNPLEHFLDCFNIVSNWKYLSNGRKNHLNSVNVIKVICGCLIIYSGEYIRRYFLGVHQDDKQSLGRFKNSTGYNLVYFSVIAFDVMFFLSGLTNTISLMNVLKLKTKENEKFSAKEYIKFYGVSVLRRLLRILPMLYLVLFFYYNVVPTELTNPMQYLWNEEFAKVCPDTIHWSYSLIGNLVKGTKFCGGFTWYLNSDIQMYLLLPIFVILVHQLQFTGKLFAICLIGTSIAGSIAIFAIEGLSLVGPYSPWNDYERFMDGYQSQPWGKVCFYFYGSLLAFYLLESKKAKGDQVKDKDEKRIFTDTNIGSLATYNIENEARERFGQLGEDKNSTLKEKLIPQENDFGRKINSESSIDINVDETDDHERVDCNWLLTTFICVLAIGTIVGLFIGFIEFSRSKDSWNIYIQVLYALSSRIIIVLAVSAVIARIEYPMERKSATKTFYWWGLLTSFSLGIYLWHNVMTEWTIASMPVNQYYEPLLIVYYSCSTIFQIYVYVVMLTLFIELPLRRLVSPKI